MSKIITTNDATVGGVPLTQSLQSWVTVEDLPVVVVGSPVPPHGSTPHDSATMVEGSSFITIDGTSACFEGDLSSCGHPATGSSFSITEN